MKETLETMESSTNDEPRPPPARSNVPLGKQTHAKQIQCMGRTNAWKAYDYWQ